MIETIRDSVIIIYLIILIIKSILKDIHEWRD